MRCHWGGRRTPYTSLMTIASFPFRRRREFALYAASVALHVLALSWVAPHLGLAAAPRGGEVPVTIMARLLAAPAPLPLPPAPAKPQKGPVHKRPVASASAAPVALVSNSAIPEQAGDAPRLSDLQSVQPAIVDARRAATGSTCRHRRASCSMSSAPMPTARSGMARMAALHLSRPPRAGVYGSRLDIWLAPVHGWYPVKIRNIEASGAITTQPVNKIEITNAGT